MKLLVLTSSTGGGHDLRAKAFKLWAEQEADLGIEVELFKPLENSTTLNRFGVELYNTIQRRLPVAHHAYWSFLEVAGLHRRPWQLSGVQGFVDKLEVYRPDWILSVHAHLNHGYMTLARQILGQGKVKVGTYCGELEGGYGFSRHWVNPQADLFIGATEACCQAARKIGMPDAKNFLGGFMLRPASYESPASADDKTSFLRDSFGLDLERFTLLLATGAVGANNHLRLLDALDKAKLDLQVIALCGKDPEVLQKVQTWQPKQSKITLAAMPYTDQMPLLLESIRAIIARGGTGTTSEAILAGCPMIVNALGSAMPQEMITIKYLKSHRLNAVMKRPADLTEILKTWLDKPEIYRNYQQQVRQALPPGSPRKVLERLLEK